MLLCKQQDNHIVLSGKAATLADCNTVQQGRYLSTDTGAQSPLLHLLSLSKIFGTCFWTQS